MKLVTKTPGVMIEEIQYEPTAAELYWWYSGTNAGPDPKNPYAPRRSSVRQKRFVSDNPAKRGDGGTV